MCEEQKNRWKRPFLIIVSGEAVSLIGSSAVQFALIWWLSSETASPIMLSVAGLAAFLPRVLLGPFVGVWIDRLPRKIIMICADLFIGLVAAAFALCFLAGTPPYWLACVVLGIRAVGDVFYFPAMQASVPMLVPPQELVRANSWTQFLQSGAYMLGPVLGALMYGALPLWVILLSDLLGGVVASACVAAVKIPDPPRMGQSGPHFFRELREGARVVFHADRRLAVVTVSTTLCMVFYLPLATLYPLMASDHFHATAAGASAVEVLYAAGMLLCAVILGRFGDLRHKFRVMHGGMLGLGATALVCGMLPPERPLFWIYAVVCGLMGASENLGNIPYVAYLQQTVAQEKQGRAFSLIGSLFSLAMPLGLAVAGPVAETFGVAAWFTVAGVGSLAVMAASAALTLRGAP